VVSQILTLFCLVIFFSINGHLHVMGLILESYKIVPIGAPLLWGVAHSIWYRRRWIDVFFRGKHYVTDRRGVVYHQPSDRHHHKICTSAQSVFIRFSHNNFQRIRIDHAFNFTICLGLFRFNGLNNRVFRNFNSRNARWLKVATMAKKRQRTPPRNA